MRTETINIYKFDELPEDVQENIIENWRNDGVFPWSDENTDVLDAFCVIFGVRVTDWDYGYQNYINWCYEGDYDHEELSGLRLQRFLVNNYWGGVFKGKYYSTKGQWIGGKYHYKSKRSRCQFGSCCPLTGHVIDDVILAPVIQYMLDPRKAGARWQSMTLTDLLYDCLRAWVYACRNDYENWLSPEAIKDDIEANEYEFYSDGTLI